MSIALRPYQHKAIEDVRAAYRCGVKSVLLQAPTGSGKTVMFSYITQGAMRLGNRVMIMAHRIELVDQISRTLKEFEVPHGLITPDTNTPHRAPINVASVQTLVRRLEQVQAPDIIIIDEAHHATKANTIGRILAHWPRARVLGVTATPVRLSGEGLNETFQGMVLGPTVQELIEIGALSPVKVYAPPTIDTSGLHIRAGDYVSAELSALVDKPKITGDAVEHYRKYADKMAAVVFCVSIDHATHVAKEFTEAGYSAMHIDGRMDKHSRKRAIEMFSKGDIHVLTSCDLISEGFDCPGIVAGISLRPTASTGLWLQQCGRCLRPFSGKEQAIILDHAGNTLRHGLPTEDREWSLEGRERSTRKSKTEQPISVRVCPRCFSADRSGIAACTSCGYVHPIAGRKISEVDGELQEVLASKAARKEQGSAQSIEALTELGAMRGYKNPRAWAEHVYRGRQARRRA